LPNVVLAAGEQARELVNALSKSSTIYALPEIAHEATSLLRRAFDLVSLLGTASEELDLSYISRPFIGPVSQNTDSEDWTILVDLVVLAFDRLDQMDYEAARALVARWTREKYPIFRRFALYAAGTSAHFTSEERMQLLL
jgi:hypothetical protein